MRIRILGLVVASYVSIGYAAEIDCSEAYGKPAKGEVVTCDTKYESFLGTWNGPFQSYVRELSKSAPVFRPFTNTVTYSKTDCLRNVSNGDTLIIGHRLDKYPEFQGLKAEEKPGRLITGRSSDGTPFLRTIDKENGLNEYKLDYQNKAANLSIWSFTYPASSTYPEMRFTTIDGQDLSALPDHKRNVTVTMSIGPKEKPNWEGVIVSGFHTLQK